MNHDEAKTKLMERRNELLGQIGKIESDIRHIKDPLDQDSQERSVQLENDEVLDALDEAGRGELARIQSALERIENGRYEICADCGGEIGAGRLAAMPSADRCIRCAESAE